MRALLTAALLAAGCSGMAPQPPAPPARRVVVLGAAQDGGLPHLGCFRDCCARARAAGRHEPVAALALVDGGDWWLVDATPDLPQQVHAMGSLPRGILLTHAHVGHYTGLMHLGREVLGARGMPVYCSEALAAFLRANGPWEQLVRLGNVELRTFRSGESFALGGNIQVEAVRVPHRDEYADTHAFGVQMRGCAPLLYLPDLDRWEGWEEQAAALWARYPLLVVDGTFYSGDELGGRDMREIPHPPVSLTLERLAVGGPSAVWFTHLNHTNPLWDPASAEARAVAQRGFRVARAGEVLCAAPAERDDARGIGSRP